MEKRIKGSCTTILVGKKPQSMAQPLFHETMMVTKP